jgi:hypothetical protein
MIQRETEREMIQRDVFKIPPKTVPFSSPRSVKENGG